MVSWAATPSLAASKLQFYFLSAMHVEKLLHEMAD